MSNVTVKTIVSETMSAAAAANTGSQRAASQSIGNRRATGVTISHGFCGSEMTTMVIITTNATSATMPSMISLRGGGLRKASAKPITKGATVMIPTVPDANQWYQVVEIGTVGLWNNL